MTGSSEAVENYAKAIYSLQHRTGGDPVATNDLADRLEVTELRHAEDSAFVPGDGDVRAPAIPTAFQLITADPTEGEHLARSGVRYRFLTYARA